MTIDTTIQSDVDSGEDLSRDDAAALFLKKWEDTGDNQSSDTDKGDTDANDEETVEGQSENEEENSEDQADEEGEENAEEDDKGAKETLADDNHVIKFSLDGKEHSATVKDLRRLAGQEASLTRKSQEIATKRKEVETTGATYLAGLHKLATIAEQDYAPYANIDFLEAAKSMDSEEFNALREDALAKYERVRFLQEELGGFMQQHEARMNEDLKERAKECIKVLSDPDGGIDGWSPQMYRDITGYALQQGLPQDTVNRLVDPVVFKLLHKAMSYDKVKTVATKKKAAAPKKVLKSNIASTAGKPKVEGRMKQLQKTGSREDAAEALMAKWGVGSDD